MLNSIKTRLKVVEEKRKLKRIEKEQKKQEKIKLWNMKQEELKTKIDNYFSKHEEFIDFIKSSNFETLYKIYNQNQKYDEYFKIYEMLSELRRYDYRKHEEIGGVNFFSKTYSAFEEKIKNYNDELMREFLKNPSRFKELIEPYTLLDEDIYIIIYNQFKNKLDDVLWSKYDTEQVKKLKFLYDIFLKEARVTAVNFSLLLDTETSSNIISGSGDGDVKYKEKQSIYKFVFSDIRYCKLLDQI